MTTEGAAPVPEDAPPVKKREIFGWAMYDFANSSYTTVVISVVYSAFFTGYIVPESSEIRDTYWSIAIVASTVLAIVLSPLVGAICDFTGGKKRYLAYSTVACALSTMALYFVAPGNVWLAIGLITLSNAAFMIGEAFVGSFLPELATKKTMGVISGLGWGLGYFGGLLSMLLIMFTITAEPETYAYLENVGAMMIESGETMKAIAAAQTQAMESYVMQNRVAMLIIGVFFAVAALPTFLLVRERAMPVPGYEDSSFGQLMKAGMSEMLASYKLAREYEILFKFFLAFTVYMAGLEVVIKFIGIYATQELGLTPGDLIWMFLIIQISAAVGALAFGYLEAKIGAKPTVLATIVWWIIGILAIYFLDPIAGFLGSDRKFVFFGISLIAGGGIGSIQSSSRAVVGLLSPANRSAQMFGFWGMFSRVAIILGMTFGLASDVVGRRTALLLVVAFFVVGGVMLWFVPIEEGIRAAAEEEAANEAG